MLRTGLTLLAIAIIAALPTAARAQGKTSDTVVKTTATGGKIENDKQTITITLDIENPWHLYANPVDNEDYAASATLVTITGEKKPESVKITYPKGTLLKEEGTNFMIYEGKIEITAEVVRAKGDTGPLKVKVKMNACTSGKGGVCLMPGTKEIEIK